MTTKEVNTVTVSAPSNLVNLCDLGIPDFAYSTLAYEKWFKDYKYTPFRGKKAESAPFWKGTTAPVIGVVTFFSYWDFYLLLLISSFILRSYVICVKYLIFLQLSEHGSIQCIQTGTGSICGLLESRDGQFWS